MNKDYVITINREVGSGGRTVGRMLAQRLGVPFYDKALINALTEMYHLSVEEIEELKDVYDTLNGPSDANAALADNVLRQAAMLPFMQDNTKQ